ncbi:hypothetical protein ABPH35_05340 [Streptococcus sp. ZJ93]|uniref:hypothetical protein n=1 Tax=Streptococcus handemini TaxID=3161188 RepID=UPI0032EB60C1
MASKKAGLVFIPKCHLDIKEVESDKHYHVFIRETAQFFIYNKEAPEFNQSICIVASSFVS